MSGAPLSSCAVCQTAERLRLGKDFEEFYGEVGRDPAKDV